VSVLLCDLVGYTGLADGRDPEETPEMLSGYFDLARAVVGRRGGQVEKFIGDAVMAVWGAPAAHEDDAERAVRAGLDMVDAVSAYGSRRQPGLQARVGIASGSVATVGSAEEGLVVGDRVNLAARVQTTASPGACMVDDTTRRLAEAAIAFEDAGVHQLKGLDEPVRLHRALRVTSRRGGTRPSSELAAPLVGREAELRGLRELFQARAERRSVRLVVVSGPAGVGKSRTDWELEKYADGLAGTVIWHRGRCMSHGEGVTFWALAEMVRQRLAIIDDDAAVVAESELTEGLVRMVPEADREYVTPAVARLLGTAGAGGTALGPAEPFAGWRPLFERLAAVSPVVAVVEDADDGLVDFLEHLVDWVRDLPVFVLVLARPELLERRPGTRDRAQPHGVVARPARPTVARPAGRRPGPRTARRRPRRDRCLRRGDAAVRHRDRPLPAPLRRGGPRRGRGVPGHRQA